jgi:micrococcal nuclease
VIGIIASLVAAILLYENLEKDKKNPGKYAEEIKAGVLYRVIQVLDGDTLIANVSGHEVTLRMIGIDTPEVVDPRKPVQCFGPEASEKAKELLTDKEIYIEKDWMKEKGPGSYDVYGRVLAYVRLPDKTLYNRYMVENGYAREYTFNKESYALQKEFRAEQKKAQKGKMGLWAICK